MMAKYTPISGYKYECTCKNCGKTFYEKLYRKDIARYCSWNCANSRFLNDLTGKRFGRLKVISFNSIKNRYANWECECDCGNTTIVRGSHLIEGTTISCGCYAKETARKKMKELASTHNLSNSRLYKVYTSIKSRCYTKNNPEYKSYGERGIIMCEEWKKNFKAFYNWAIQNGYDETADFGKCTIDRIDNNGNYEPSNCRWVSMKEQSLNKRNNRKIEYKGEIYTVKEISKIKNCSYGAIQWRLNNGWSGNEIFEIDIDNIHFNPRNNKKGAKKKCQNAKNQNTRKK